MTSPEILRTTQTLRDRSTPTTVPGIRCVRLVLRGSETVTAWLVITPAATCGSRGRYSM